MGAIRYSDGPSSYANNLVLGSGDIALDTPTRKLYVGTTGNVHVTMTGGSNALFVAVPAGTQLDIRVTNIIDATTTANNLVAMY